MSRTRHTFRGTTYRALSPLWAHDPISGQGATRHGGRFNPPGVADLYTSLDPATATLEAQQDFIRKAQPYTMVAFDIDCADLVDLTSAAGRSETATTVEALACPWLRLQMEGEPVPTQELTRRLIADGIAGAFVPSFAPGAAATGACLVFWDWGPETPHRVAVIDDYGRLPKSSPSKL